MKSFAFLRPILPLSALFCALNAGRAQTATAVLAQAYTAFSQSTPVKSVTLNATARRIAGSDDETGNAVLIASADGSFSVHLQLTTGSRTEAQTSFASGQSCSWSGTDGVSHATAVHNCVGSVAWFLPAVSLFGNHQPSTVTTLIENSPNTSVQLIDVRQQRTPLTASASDVALLTHVSAMDLYLDPTSYLPTSLGYSVHPDQNAASDIPAQVIFTNYQTVNGVSIPFRIQQYLNGVLTLDLTVTQAATN